jgi:hypothetical protein
LTCEQFAPVVAGFPPSARQVRESVDNARTVKPGGTG